MLLWLKMWKVEFESVEVEKEVECLIKSKELSREDRIVVSTWIRQIAEEGPEAIQNEKRWDDHELDDDWKGYRSSCFSRRGRIIYRVIENIIKIKIARVTPPKHDYRKKR